VLYEDTTDRIIAAALEVHSALGAGLLESSYDTCLAHEFMLRGFQFDHQLKLPVSYKGISLDAGYRLDFLVERRVILELKAVERLLPVHDAQLITYLKLSGYHVGLLINFNVPHLRRGIKRLVNGYPLPNENHLPSVSSDSSVVKS
jgi:GxxExxY protein